MKTLYERLQPAIHAEVASTLFPSATVHQRDARQDAIDLVQDVFVALLARDAAVLRSWDPERGAKLETFVRMVAHRYVLGVLRTRSRNPYELEPIDFEQLDRIAASEAAIESRVDARTLLHQLDGELDERGRGLFRQLFAEGRPTAEVASSAGMTHNAVYAWSARLGRKLRAMLDVQRDSFQANEPKDSRDA